MSARRRITLKELAAELDVSVTTVSRALAGYADVSPATRTRITETAARLGYVPSKAGRMLVSGRTDFIGMALPLRDDAVVDPFLGAFITGLSEGSAADGRDLLIVTAPAERTLLDVIRHMVESARVDALVLYRTEVDDPRVRYLIDQDFPFVSHGRSLAEKRPYVWLDTDGEACFLDAATSLVETGHRDFALLTTAEPYAFAALRRRGVEAALAAAGLSLPGDAVAAVPMGKRDEALAAAERLLRRERRPTAVLCVTDALALAVLETASRLGIRVPAELSVIGFDNVPASAYLAPGLSTFDQRARETGREVAAMVAALLEEGPGAVPSRLVRPDFVPRGSHGPARQERRPAAA